MSDDLTLFGMSIYASEAVPRDQVRLIPGGVVPRFQTNAERDYWFRTPEGVRAMRDGYVIVGIDWGRK